MGHDQDDRGSIDPGTIRPGTAQPETMDEAAAATELAGLAAAIGFHDMRYHGEDDPVISDADYDALVARNRELEAAFPRWSARTARACASARPRQPGSARCAMRARCCR